MSLLPVFVQIRDVAERLEAKRALIQTGSRMRRHVFRHCELHGEALATHFAFVWARVDGRCASVLPMAHHVEGGAEHLAAEVAADGVLLRVDRFHVFRHAGPTAHLLAAQCTLDRFAQVRIVLAFVRLETAARLEHLGTVLTHVHLVAVGRALVCAESFTVETVAWKKQTGLIIQYTTRRGRKGQENTYDLLHMSQQTSFTPCTRSMWFFKFVSHLNIFPQCSQL